MTCMQQTRCRSVVHFSTPFGNKGLKGSQVGIQIRTMRVVKGLYLLNRRLFARVHKADVALAADCYQGFCHSQTHDLLAVLQPHLRGKKGFCQVKMKSIRQIPQPCSCDAAAASSIPFLNAP